ncbi:MAG TPA: diguanylate cyclase [Pyrinomonadaceae bacterium]|nr:diguanylate cyclase [Pyrinomonadaceae bacterium]
MTRKKLARLAPIEQELPERAPGGWDEVQQSVAADSGIAVLLVEGYQPPALAVSNNNSICEAMQSSPEHVRLCDPFCGLAHKRAANEGAVVHYRCHAGLQCFSLPVEINTRQLAVIGGRAFSSGKDYREFVERVRSGDLHELAADELFRNVIFADEGDLDHAALRLSRAAEEFREKPVAPAPVELPAREEKPASDEPLEAVEERRVERAPYVGLDRRAPFADSIRRFAEQIDAAEPSQIYESILAQSADLLDAERGSLWLFDEESNQLNIKAARGIPVGQRDIEAIRVGEGIAGSVISSGQPLVTTIDALGKPSLPERKYKTGSFISYPITIGARKIGVLNVTDRRSGAAYQESDLEVIDLVAPQIALALERATWQHRANQFQLMSITDPLTGLHNRRYMEARLSEELNRSKRYDFPMSFMMIDIDDFKHYNDRNGHQAGDRALEITAQCLRSTLRKVDVASRYGGEEFTILLPQTTLKEAGAIADRLRREIMTTKFPHGASQPQGAVTISIGLSSLSSSVDSAEAMIRAADRALYYAKSHGKNRAYAYQGAGS